MAKWMGLRQWLGLCGNGPRGERTSRTSDSGGSAERAEHVCEVSVCGEYGVERKIGLTMGYFSVRIQGLTGAKTK